MSINSTSLTSHTCSNINTANSQDINFFSGNTFSDEYIGWTIAGVSAVLTTLITLINVFLHARNYYVPREQRQILRILLMPAVYAIISFFSYRYYRAYTYFQLGVVVYESIVIVAFLMLLLQYIGSTAQAQQSILVEKDRTSIPFPFCCIHYSPSKPYFLHALKWSVLQYAILRPLISVAGVVTDAKGVYCPTGYSIYFAEVYLDSVDFVSISIALYGLIVFYALVRDRLKGRQPLSKFLSIKGIIIITFYQGFVFTILQTHNVIKGTTYWTSTNVANGLQALCTCIEMVVFSLIFLWSFSSTPYRKLARDNQYEEKTSVFFAILDSLNYSDFILEAWRGIVFMFRYILGKPDTRTLNLDSTEENEKNGTSNNNYRNSGPMNIDEAFSNNGNGNNRGNYYTNTSNGRRSSEETLHNSNNNRRMSERSTNRSNGNNTRNNSKSNGGSRRSSNQKPFGNVGSINDEGNNGRAERGSYSSAEIYRSPPPATTTIDPQVSNIPYSHSGNTLSGTRVEEEAGEDGRWEAR